MALLVFYPQAVELFFFCGGLLDSGDRDGQIVQLLLIRPTRPAAQGTRMGFYFLGGNEFRLRQGFALGKTLGVVDQKLLPLYSSAGSSSTLVTAIARSSSCF